MVVAGPHFLGRPPRLSRWALGGAMGHLSAHFPSPPHPLTSSCALALQLFSRTLEGGHVGPWVTLLESLPFTLACPCHLISGLSVGPRLPFPELVPSWGQWGQHLAQ